MSGTLLSNGARFVRGYFRFLGRVILFLCALATILLLSLAIADFIHPDWHIYSRAFTPAVPSQSKAP